AYAEPRDRFVAALFLGLSRFRQGDYNGADRYLTEASKDPELRASAQYYDGLALLRAGRETEAKERFSSVQAERPDADIGRASAQYVQTGVTPPPPSPPPAEAAAAPPRPWSAHAGFGFEYDSNVVLASSESVVRDNRNIDHEADGRVVIAAGGLYHALQR